MLFSFGAMVAFFRGVMVSNVHRRLITEGVAVWGRIVRKNEVVGRGDSVFNWVTFRYRLRSGSWLEAKMRVDE